MCLCNLCSVISKQLQKQSYHLQLSILIVKLVHLFLKLFYLLEIILILSVSVKQIHFFGGLTVLVDELLALTQPRPRHHHVAQSDVPGVVRVVRHPATNPHYQHVLHPLESAQQPGGGAPGGDARLPAVSSHGQLGHHTPVAPDISDGVGLGLSW